MCDFWSEFDSFLDESIPKIIIDILQASGYDNVLSLLNMNEIEINKLEEFVNNNLQSLLEKIPQYSTSKPFSFLPGHRKLLLILGNKAKQYDEIQKKKCSNLRSSRSNNNATPIMNELISSMEANLNVAPTARRYSDACKNYAMYMYMLSGKAAYEALCSNLPLPQVGTVCKYFLAKLIHVIHIYVWTFI